MYHKIHTDSQSHKHAERRKVWPSLCKRKKIFKLLKSWSTFTGVHSVCSDYFRIMHAKSVGIIRTSKYCPGATAGKMGLAWPKNKSNWEQFKRNRSRIKPKLLKSGKNYAGTFVNIC